MTPILPPSLPLVVSDNAFEGLGFKTIKDPESLEYQDQADLQQSRITPLQHMATHNWECFWSYAFLQFYQCTRSRIGTSRWNWSEVWGTNGCNWICTDTKSLKDLKMIKVRTVRSVLYPSCQKDTVRKVRWNDRDSLLRAQFQGQRLVEDLTHWNLFLGTFWNILGEFRNISEHLPEAVSHGERSTKQSLEGSG